MPTHTGRLVRRPFRLRTATVLAASVICVATLVGVAAPNAAAAVNAPPGGPELGPLESGKSGYVAGTFVWTDYAYDDRGASQPPPAVPDPTTSSPGGVATYPADAGENAADLVQLQLARTSSGLQVRAVLETLTDPDVPQLVVGLDTDANNQTGSPALPGAWAPKTPLGLERAVVVDSSGARLLQATPTGWATIGQIPAAVDPGDNTMTATVPSTALPVPTSGSWNVVAALGLSGMASGSSQPYDLAYVGNESPTPSTAWLSQLQGDILASLAPAGPAVGSMDLALMSQGATQLPDVRTAGFHFFLYHSALQLPEGIVRQSSAVGNNDRYLGPYQPYMVNVPASMPAPVPMLLDLHGAGGSYFFDAQYVTGADTVVTRQLIVPGMQVNALVVSPHARGGGLFYEGIAEQDVLDVYQDVQRYYAVDTSKVVLEGGSMGGMGTFRLASLYPDKFIGAVTIVGAQPYDYDTYWIASVGQPVGVSRSKQLPSEPGFADNLRNVPVRMSSGTADPLVAPTATTATMSGLETRQYDYQFFLLTKRSHSFVLPLENCLWNELFATRTLDPSPAHVTYRVYPSQFMTDASSGLDLHYSGAYWVSGMQVRAGADSGVADLTSQGVALRTVNSATNVSIDNNLLVGRDLCGPNPAVHTQDVWEKHGRTNTLSQAPVANVVNGDLSGLDTVTINAEQAKLVADQPIDLQVTGDGVTTITLTGVANGAYTLSQDGSVIANLTVTGNQAVLPGVALTQGGTLLHLAHR